MSPRACRRRLVALCFGLHAVLGRAEMVETTQTVEVLPVLLYASPTARRALTKTGGDLKANVNRWRDLLKARKQPYAIVTNPDRLLAAPHPATVVVPSAVALHEREARAIAHRVAQGDHLLVTLAPLTAAGDGDPAQRLVTDIFDVGFAARPPEPFTFAVLPSASPLTGDLQPGTRLWLDQAGQALRTTSPDDDFDAFYSDWSRSGSSGLARHRLSAGSRQALLAWPESAWGGQPAAFQSIAEAALDWVSNRPLAVIAEWPFPYRGAVSLGVDVGGPAADPAPLAIHLRELGIAASFNFMLTDLGARRQTLETLHQLDHGLGVFGEQWVAFAGLSVEAQRQRIDRVLAGLRALPSHFAPETFGLRAPEGRTDEATEAAAAPFAYLVDVGRYDGLLPKAADAGHTVVLRNAYNLGAAIDGLTARTELLDQLGPLSRLGGHAYIGLESGAFARNDGVFDAIADLARSARESAIWVAEAARVAAWRRARERVRLLRCVAGANESMIEIEVSPGEALPDGMALLVFPPAGRRLLPLPSQLSAPAAADGRIALSLRGLEPGTHRLRVPFSP